MNTAYSRKKFRIMFQIQWIQIKNQKLFCEFSIFKKNIQNNISNSMDSEKHSGIIL
jgi:hypothetical protein